MIRLLGGRQDFESRFHSCARIMIGGPFEAEFSAINADRIPQKPQYIPTDG